MALFDYMVSSALREDNRKVLMAVREKHLDPSTWQAVVFIRDFLAMHRILPTKAAVETHIARPLLETSDAADHWYDKVLGNFRRRVTEEAVMQSALRPNEALSIFRLALVEADLAADDSRVRAFEEGAVARFQDYRKYKGATGIRHLSTYEDHINEVTFGYWPSDFWIIGGQEGAGKTWLLSYMAVIMDKELTKDDPIGRPILFINTELDDEEITERMDAQYLNIPYGQILSGTLSSADELKWNREARRLQSRLRVIDDCFTLDDLERYVALLNPIAVFVDSVHVLVPDYDWKDFAVLGTRCKRIAKTHRCPIIANTHLKGGEGKDAQGSTESFAYGKGFTRNASVAAMLFQDDQMELAGEIGLKFVKVRRGEKGTLVFRHNWTTMIYEFVGTLGKQGSIYTTDDDDEDYPW